MAKSGTPIRLIREDGGLIELNATKIVMSTDRRFGPKSVPFSGSNRVSIDLNLNKAVILIQGFFSDDEIAIAGSKAKATIDFNVADRTEWIDGGRTDAFATETNLRAFFATAQNTKLTLKDVNGVDRVLNMVLGSSNAYNSSTQTVTVTATATPVEIATVVKSGLDTSYGASFTTERVNGGEPVGGSVSSSKLIITQASNGEKDYCRFSPSFSMDNELAGFRSPDVTTFAGGKSDTMMSAGDKAQDMYSIMNNSSRSTFRAASRGLMNAFEWQHKETDLQNKKKASDYIVGIQIPFNSLQTDNDYTPKNFFMPTGWYDKNEKDSSNAMAAGTEFSGVDNFTGISGGMKSMEIMYDAGEAVYTFDMQFLPSDVMI
tara:strand:+ start:1812 stop:2933 length:1122 start_codon:yes stop_codon:yes gene_type:complete